MSEGREGWREGGKERERVGGRKGGLTFHMMVNWVELFSDGGNHWTCGDRRLKLCCTNHRGSLREAVVMAMFAGLLTRPTALVIMTCMV